MTIQFKAKLSKVGSWTILRLPKEASLKLPSRSMCWVKGTINGSPFNAGLEPDGRGSHWLRFDQSMAKATGASKGDTLELEMEPIKQWPDPPMPADLKKALAASAQARALWKDITPSARWDWIRWIRATNVAQTRQKHVQVAISKMLAGERRPCCFNRNICTQMDVCRGGVLPETAKTKGDT